MVFMQWNGSGEESKYDIAFWARGMWVLMSEGRVRGGMVLPMVEVVDMDILVEEDVVGLEIMEKECTPETVWVSVTIGIKMLGSFIL